MTRRVLCNWLLVLGCTLCFGVAVVALMNAARGLHVGRYWVPFVSSLALVITNCRAKAALPWPVIAGHGLSALIGFMATTVLGSTVSVLVGSAILALFVMMMLRTVHPPATATPLVMGMHPNSFVCLFAFILLGATLVALIGAAMRTFECRMYGSLGGHSGSERNRDGAGFASPGLLAKERS